MQSAYRNLSDFIRTLEQAGELLRIKAPVSTDLEITQITDLASKSPGGGRALLFENVVGSAFPVLTNAFGSERRMALALGVTDLDSLAARLRGFIQLEPPKSVADGLRLLPMGLDLLRFFPRRWRSRRDPPPCQQVVWRGAQVDLGKLPILKCWPQDGGPFVTLPVVITRSLTTGRRNAGMYRLQVYDRNTTGMHWHIHKDGSNYYSEYRKAGRRMPVAVAIGTDPATTYAATAPMPRGIDELILAGFIRRKPVTLAQCLTIDLQVPAEAEFVLEGYVDPDELRIEGPFGDHTGYYSLTGPYPVFHVTAVTHRRQPVYPATIVGRPPMEDCYMAKATERIFLPLLNTVLPEIKDYWLPWEGVFHNITVIAIAKEYPAHARRIMSALWGQGQMSFCKALVVVDESADLKNPRELLRAILDSIDLAADLYPSEGILDVLDHSAPDPLFGGKLGIDATPRVAGEHPRSARAAADALPDAATALAAGQRVGPRLSGARVVPLSARNPVLLLNFAKDGTVSGRDLAAPLLAQPELAPFTIVVLCDAAIDLEDASWVWWKVFNNVDPKRDLVRIGDRMVVDATKKGPEDGHLRPWPDDIVMTPDVVRRVVERARDLGLADWV
ncbi:MAG: menaquinone biosynthesis decarboxylase [Syntrophobacteraceae bacterium CG2_30_61_12]|nr:MAG: menaquinone biosynthesis decarboxylase [Syntrophobacteraceae bacterium CG2_30_61_12]